MRHFSYDDKGRANNQYDPGGGTWKFVYGTNATTVTQPNGSVSQFSFDNTGHEIKSVDPTGDIKYKTWANGLLTDERDEFGGTTHWDYDANGNTTSYKRPEDSATKTTSYDLATNLPKVVTPVVGAATQFTIAPNSVDVIKVQRGNLSISYSRDAFGNVLSTDNGQAIYSVQRDSNGLITHTFDLHNPASMTYDIRGRVTSMNYLSGRILTYTYNDDDQVLSVSDSHGPSIANTYDLIGRLVQKTVSAGSVSQSTLFKYDDRDHLVETTDALHRQTIFSYDSQVVRDKPVSIQDPAGRITSFQYDALNRLVAKTDPLGAVTSYAYDLRGNLTGVTDASGNQTTYIYDKNDRRISEIRPSVGGGSSPVFRRQDYFYDSADHLVKEMINGHRELNYSYDSLDRLVEKDLLTDGSPEDFASFSYENQLDAVLLRTANNSIAHLSFAHESAPPFALSSFGVADGGGGHYLPNWGTYSIARDVTGEIASVSGSGGIIFSKSYDPAGRLTGVASGPFSSSIGYDGFGRRQSVVHSDGASGGFQYDLLNRITNVAWSGPTPISEALSYDVAGNITNIQRENGAYTVAYDAVDQLVSSTGVYNRAMQYDLMGNRIQDSVNGVGHFVSNYLTDNGSFRTYAPDPNGMGNLATQFQGTARKNYKYRADDRLREYDDSSANIQHNYYYDALGRRAVKDFSPTGIGPGFTQSYVYLGEEDRILMGKSGDGTVTAYLDGQGIDDHLAEVSSGAAKGYVTDHLGSVLNSDAAGAAHSFGLFGETANVSESASAAPLHYGFAGRQLDGESSTYFNRARNYNPLTGTWLSQDPIGYASGDANYYRYAMGNPLRFTDPSGLANAGPGGFGQVGGDEGVQLLVDYYHGQAASGAPVNQNQAEWAHAIAVNDRNTAGPQNMNEVQAATEHYLWSNSEVLNGGTLKSIAYDFLPEGYQLAKLLGFFPDATPASQLELKWGQKGSNDAYNQKTSCP
ncbi:MAG: RHS repeat-associated core domain-containing protein [Bdellovibrionota bacterium]